MVEEKPYTVSEKTSVPGIIATVILGLLSAALTAYLYSFLTVIIPFVYLNFLITAGYGIALGFCVKFLSRLAKSRSLSRDLIIAGVIGVSGFFSQWVAHLLFLLMGEHSFAEYVFNFNVLFKPYLWTDLVIQLSETGSWSVFGKVVSGLLLWAVWIVEAVLIVGLPVLVIRSSHPSH